jgi:hypothetical protein
MSKSFNLSLSLRNLAVFLKSEVPNIKLVFNTVSTLNFE